MPPAPRRPLVGGWQVNGIYTWQRGFPLTVTAADLGGLNDSFGANRADLVGDPNSGGHSIQRWFNTAAFAQPAAGQFGNSGRNILRGPGVNNLDLAVFKNFSLRRPHQAAVPARVVQRAQSHAVQFGRHQPDVADLRRGEWRASRVASTSWG